MTPAYISPYGASRYGPRQLRFALRERVVHGPGDA
jgi:hypothetical protein